MYVSSRDIKGTFQILFNSLHSYILARRSEEHYLTMLSTTLGPHSVLSHKADTTSSANTCAYNFNVSCQ